MRSNAAQNQQPDAAVQGQAGLRKASERFCMPPPGHNGGGQPEVAVQGQGALCLPPGGDAGKEGSPRLPKAAVLCQGGLLCTPEAAVLCCVYKIFKGQAGLCLHSGGDAGKEGSPRLPKAAFQCQGELLCTPEAAEAVICQGRLLCTPEAAEAAVLCQGGRMVFLESCLQASERLCMPPPGHAGGGQPEAAVQGRGRLCLPSRGDAGKEGSPRLPKAAFQCQVEQLCTPEAAEAAVLCQAGLRRASERLCGPTPGYAGGGQPEAVVQGQGALCWPPGGDAGKEGSPRLPKAAVLCQGGLLCTPEAAEAEVLCGVYKIFKGQTGLCLHSGGDAGKEGSPRLPEAVICQGQLLCTAEAAEAAVLCQGRLLCTPEAAEAAVLCCVYKIFKGQAGLCLHSGGDAGKEGSPRLPKAAFQCQGELLCTPEAAEAVLCQGELLCTPEAAEAAVLCQGRLLCTPEAAEAAVLCCVYKIVKGQAGLCWPPGGDAGKEGSPRLPKAAVLCQGGLLCTPEAAEAAVLCCVYKIFKGQAGLCLHSGGDAGKEGSPRLPKAAVLCQGRLLCT
jgi:SpoU rRNA methylase family enzyme